MCLALPFIDRSAFGLVIPVSTGMSLDAYAYNEGTLLYFMSSPAQDIESLKHADPLRRPYCPLRSSLKSSERDDLLNIEEGMKEEGTTAMRYACYKGTKLDFLSSVGQDILRQRGLIKRRKHSINGWRKDFFETSLSSAIVWKVLEGFAFYRAKSFNLSLWSSDSFQAKPGKSGIDVPSGSSITYHVDIKGHERVPKVSSNAIKEAGVSVQ
ncbi:Glutamine-dependent NAD(+) synthetase [Striga asiatica]|uniref:Glutamine-dependent NAD(+) synthetase n=1 Tax=Striga asiatica TaxID=4170 RepID=A0A5A7QB26_STRAF|nr:Glutamine-dependent NAD(+) synthetase [Striga asiatica]